MRYEPATLPFTTRELGGLHLAVSRTGDHAFLNSHELDLLRNDPAGLPTDLRGTLQARFFVGTRDAGIGQRRLIASRIAAKRETVDVGPSLHIIVPTLQCAHSCRYCQVSRSLGDEGHAMTEADLDAACDSILQSHAPTLTVEFQGGDPLIRFDLIQRAVLRISDGNRARGRRIRFVIASTLHQLDAEMCDFLATHGVLLSTSIDGPPALHNRNRPIPGRDSHERTLAGVALARSRLGPDAVSALMTTTRASLDQPEAIVDEYVRLGFHEIFLRPLSSYGFAKRNQAHLGYGIEAFIAFYRRGLERVLYWNRQGVPLREVYASILLNKALCTFDGATWTFRVRRARAAACWSTTTMATSIRVTKPGCWPRRAIAPSGSAGSVSLSPNLRRRPCSGRSSMPAGLNPARVAGSALTSCSARRTPSTRRPSSAVLTHRWIEPSTAGATWQCSTMSSCACALPTRARSISSIDGPSPRAPPNHEARRHRRECECRAGCLQGGRP